MSAINTPPMMSGKKIMVGHLFEFMKDMGQTIQRGYEEQGNIFSMKLANKNFAVLVGPQYAKMYHSQTDKKLRIDKAYKMFEPLLGEAAFCCTPETYQNRLPILMAPFNPTKLKNYIAIKIAEVQERLDTWGESGEFELTNEVEIIARNVAAHCLMGKQFRDEMNDEFWALFADISAAIDPVIPHNWPLPKFRKRDRAKARLVEILTPIVKDRRENPDKYDDLLQISVETETKDGKLLTVEQLVDQVVMLAFAGHDTTRGQVSWAIIQLLQHPGYLKAMQQEITNVLPTGKPMTAADMPQLQHVRWAIEESLRMNPVGAFIMRHADENIEVDGYTIPKDWQVIYAVKTAHFMEEIYTKPEQYDPYRFSPDRKEHKKMHYSLASFGGGIHLCKGMNFAYNEMTIILALIFQQFELELVSPKDPQPVWSNSAVGPEETIVRYKRRPKMEISEEVMKEAIAAGCPHFAQMEKQGS